MIFLILEIPADKCVYTMKNIAVGTMVVKNVSTHNFNSSVLVPASFLFTFFSPIAFLIKNY